MAYFNHAFCKTFLGTKRASTNTDQSNGLFNGPGAEELSGFVYADANAPTHPGVPPVANYATVDLINGGAGVNLGIGSFGFFDPKTWYLRTQAAVVSTPCCPLVLASTALYQKDGIGQAFSGGGTTGNFHGGYQESNKSKVINPKYISRVYRVDPCTPNQNVVAVGSTPYTFATGLDCCKEFLCDQSYTLRLDIKGSPALRMLDHNAYFETSTWTGCCPPNALAPVAVDPTTVYIYWATQLLNSPLISPFIQITVYDQAGNNVGGANDTNAWAAYVAQPVVACVPGVPTPGSGMAIVGAYVDTVFGDCTFYPTDFFEKQPVHIYASMVDLTGSVCDFEGVCVTEQCCPRQGNGFGDTVLKDLILSERYQQNDFYTGTDLRIREITQGYDVTAAVNRQAFYTRYVLQHSVPRFNNPSGTFDNDQYLLEVITNGIDVNLEAFLNAWIFTPACNACDVLEVISCGPTCCVPLSLEYTDQDVVTTALPLSGTAPYTVPTPGAIGLTGLTLNADGTITGTAGPGAANGTINTGDVIDSNGMIVGCFDVQVNVVV